MMTRNLIAVRGEFENVDSPIWLRLYRHRDTIEFGKAYAAYGTPEQKARYGYNYGKDTNNGTIDPPSSGSDGQVFWIEQTLPAEKTFPDGFRYVLAGLVIGPGCGDTDGRRRAGSRDETVPERSPQEGHRGRFGHGQQHARL